MNDYIMDDIANQAIDKIHGFSVGSFVAFSTNENIYIQKAYNTLIQSEHRENRNKRRARMCV